MKARKAYLWVLARREGRRHWEFSLVPPLERHSRYHTIEVGEGASNSAGVGNHKSSKSGCEDEANEK